MTLDEATDADAQADGAGSRDRIERALSRWRWKPTRAPSTKDTSGAEGEGPIDRSWLQRLRFRRSSTRVKERKERPPKEALDIIKHHDQSRSLRKLVIQNAVPVASASAFLYVVIKVLL